MITESDLRAILTEEARDVSESDDILARLHLAEPRRHQPRRWLAPVAAAAAVAAIVTVAVAVVVMHRPTAAATTLPPPLGDELRYTMTVGTVRGYDTTTDREILARSERTNVMFTPYRNGASAGNVTVYDQGAYDPRPVMQGLRLTVQGRPAYYRVLPAVRPFQPTPTLAWRASDGRWIIVQGWNDATTKPRRLGALTEERRIAAAVDTSASEPMRLPFRIGYLPPGLTVVGAISHTLPPPVRPWWGATLTLARPEKPVFRIGVSAHTPGDGFTPNIRLDGHPAWIGIRAAVPRQPSGHTAAGHPPAASILTVDLGPALLMMNGPYPGAELVKIAESIVLAPNVNHPSTWFDATK
jgi:hypothetical protein